MIPLRDDTPTHRPPIATMVLIGACAVAFLWQLGQGSPGMEIAIYRLGMIPAVLLGTAPADIAAVPPALTLVTSMFLHGGWMHLLGNMLYLWIFGNNVEDRLGHLPFVVFYLACGLVAAAAQILPDPGSGIPMVGASGAISGVLGAYVVLFPHARVLVMIPVGILLFRHVRAAWVLGIWFAMQFVSAMIAPSGSGVAWWAHVGGFVTGFLAMQPLRRRLPSRRHRPGPWG
ncbi:MAG TPA: rhomboid family intramembrane serine protease [Geminicoccaceae bacterium]|nr:rhomboid family intramembrane serine protease [Geminicoccus sp.]HMU48798.1 rhomboid family intramembrane serine protease [Geminicoccaceae bacterium]